MTKFQETMSSAQAGALARLLQIITPILLAILAWYYIGSDGAKNAALAEMQRQLVTMSIQIARIEEQGNGTRANQAIIDAEQNRRLERLEAQRFGSPGNKRGGGRAVREGRCWA